MSNLQWFRLYHRIIDDEKIRLLAFEDRWHFIAVCCLKADGLMDEPNSDLKWRKIAVKMGVQLRELDEIKRRLSEVGLVDADMQPVAWDELQYRSDTSTERVRKYREKTKCKPDETQRNVSVTPQDTETDTETDTEREKKEPKGSSKKRGARLPGDFSLPAEWRDWALKRGLPAERIPVEFEKLTNWAANAPASKAVKRDWFRAWQNWVIGAIDALPRARGSPAHTGSQISILDSLIGDMTNGRPDQDRRTSPQALLSLPGHEHR